jgi:hypothetical protein
VVPAWPSPNLCALSGNIQNSAAAALVTGAESIMGMPETALGPCRPGALQRPQRCPLPPVSAIPSKKSYIKKPLAAKSHRKPIPRAHFSGHSQPAYCKHSHAPTGQPGQAPTLAVAVQALLPPGGAVAGQTRPPTPRWPASSSPAPRCPATPHAQPGRLGQEPAHDAYAVVGMNQQGSFDTRCSRAIGIS